MTETSTTARIAQLTLETPEKEIVDLIQHIADTSRSPTALNRWPAQIARKTGTPIETVREMLYKAMHANQCRFCKGARGGVPGNENIVYGMTICDYCHSDIITVERTVRDETLRAAGRLAINEAVGIEGRMAANGFNELIDAVRLTPDGRWKSEKAMVIWGRATDKTGEQLHKQYDGNGRERK
jgi:hypothetical protein